MKHLMAHGPNLNWWTRTLCNTWFRTQNLHEFIFTLIRVLRVILFVLLRVLGLVWMRLCWILVVSSNIVLRVVTVRRHCKVWRIGAWRIGVWWIGRVCLVNLIGIHMSIIIAIVRAITILYDVWTLIGRLLIIHGRRCNCQSGFCWPYVRRSTMNDWWHD